MSCLMMGPFRDCCQTSSQDKFGYAAMKGDHEISKTPLVRALRSASEIESEYSAPPTTPLTGTCRNMICGDTSDLVHDTLAQTWWQKFRKGRWTIVPDHSLKSSAVSRMEIWDCSIIFLIVFTALWVPMEMALFLATPSLKLMLVDDAFCFCFSIDIVVQFFIAFPAHTSAEEAKGFNRWEVDPLKIAAHYARWPFSRGGAAGWFWIDIMSVAPDLFYMIRRFLFQARGGSFMQVQATGGALRLLRAIKLVRLFRLFRLTRLLERWQSTFGWSFYIIDLLKFFCYTVLTCHWFSCAWVMVEGKLLVGQVSYHTDQVTWLSALVDAKGDPCTPNVSGDPLCVYTLAMYWATMTITTVGYGDIVPQNKMEYMLCTILIMVAGAFWAYVTGVVVSVLSNLDPHNVDFKQKMDDLNYMMASKKLPSAFRQRARLYLYEIRRVHKWERHRDLIATTTSDSWQREVEEYSKNRALLDRVYWVCALEEDAKLHLVKSLERKIYEPWEFIRLVQVMFVIRQGAVIAKGRIMNPGDVWGHENILLDTPALLDRCLPRTLRFTDIVTLTKSDLHNVCRLYPNASRRIRRAQVRTAAYRAFCLQAFQKSFSSRKTHQDADDTKQSASLSAADFHTDGALSSGADRDGLSSLQKVGNGGNAAGGDLTGIHEHLDQHLDRIMSVLDTHHSRLHVAIKSNKDGGEDAVTPRKNEHDVGDDAILRGGSNMESSPWTFTNTLSSAVGSTGRKVTEFVRHPLSKKPKVVIEDDRKPPPDSPRSNSKEATEAQLVIPASEHSLPVDAEVESMIFERLQALEQNTAKSHAILTRRQADLSVQVDEMNNKLETITQQLASVIAKLGTN